MEDFTCVALTMLPHRANIWRYLAAGHNRYTQDVEIILLGYTHREFKLKFSALLKDYDLKYAENSKKQLT